jgi:hypothetical protein
MLVASAAPAAADDLSNARRSIAVDTILVMTPPSLKNSANRQAPGETLTALPKLFDIRTRVRLAMSFNERLDGVNRPIGQAA